MFALIIPLHTPTPTDSTSSISPFLAPSPSFPLSYTHKHTHTHTPTHTHTHTHPHKHTPTHTHLCHKVIVEQLEGGELLVHALGVFCLLFLHNLPARLNHRLYLHLHVTQHLIQSLHTHRTT